MVSGEAGRTAGVAEHWKHTAVGKQESGVVSGDGTSGAGAVAGAVVGEGWNAALLTTTPRRPPPPSTLPPPSGRSPP